MPSFKQEFDQFVREWKATWMIWDRDHRLALLSVGGIWGTLLLPWLSFQDGSFQNGMQAGNNFPLLLGYAAWFQLQKVVTIKRQVFLSRQGLFDEASQLHRISLLIFIFGFLGALLCGIGAFFFSAFFIETHQFIDIRYGFYCHLLAQLSLLFSGLLRFLGLAAYR